MAHWVVVFAGDLKGANVLLKSTNDDPRGYTCKVMISAQAAAQRTLFLHSSLVIKSGT